MRLRCALRNAEAGCLVCWVCYFYSQTDKDGRYGNYDGLPWTRVLKLCPFMKDYAVCRAEQKAHKFTDEEKELKSQGLLFRTDVTKLVRQNHVSR